MRRSRPPPAPRSARGTSDTPQNRATITTARNATAASISQWTANGRGGRGGSRGRRTGRSPPEPHTPAPMLQPRLEPPRDGDGSIDSGGVTTDPVAIDGRSLGRRGAATRRVCSTPPRPARDRRRARPAGRRHRPAGRHVAGDLLPVLPRRRGGRAGAGRGGGRATSRRSSELLDGPWTGPDGLDVARALVDGFIEYWDAHRAILRTRNLAAQEGDRRFRDVRERARCSRSPRGSRRKVAEAQRRDGRRRSRPSRRRRRSSR